MRKQILTWNPSSGKYTTRFATPHEVELFEALKIYRELFYTAYEDVDALYNNEIDKIASSQYYYEKQYRNIMLKIAQELGIQLNIIPGHIF
jgi:hypothetical protein